MTIDTAKLRAETLALIDGTTPGPWEKVTHRGDWGLAGAHFIQPPNCPNPYYNRSAIAVVEYVTPYPIGASRKERDDARQADANARLIAAAPTIAAGTLPLLDEIERLTVENERLRAARKTPAKPAQKSIREAKEVDMTKIYFTEEGVQVSGEGLDHLREAKPMPEHKRPSDRNDAASTELVPDKSR